jgi:hypothetical protein
MGFILFRVHPETTNFRMELSAVSDQQSANTLFLMSFAESRKLMADSAPVLRSSPLRRMEIQKR